MVAYGDRFYWCDGDNLLTRRATVPELPACAPRPSAPQWSTSPTDGLTFGWAGPVVDSDDSTYLIAYESDVAAATSGLSQGSYLLKYDSAGNYLWRRQLWSFELDALDVDTKGDVLVETLDMQSVATLTKYTPDGTVAWIRPVTPGYASFAGNDNVILITPVTAFSHDMTELDGNSGADLRSVPVPGTSR